MLRIFTKTIHQNCDDRYQQPKWDYDNHQSSEQHKKESVKDRI